MRCACAANFAYAALDSHLQECPLLFRRCEFCNCKLKIEDQTHEDTCIAQIPILKRKVEQLSADLERHNARQVRAFAGAGHPDKPPTEFAGKYCCWSAQRGWNLCCGVSAQQTCHHAPDNGAIRRWYNTGDLMMHSEYKDSLQHGTHMQWYDNGACWVQCKYAGGKLCGTYTSWWANGQVNELRHHP